MNKKTFRVSVLTLFMALQARAAVKPGFFLDTSYNYVLTNGSSLAAPFGSASWGVDRDLAMGADFGLGYQFSSGFAILAGCDYFYRLAHVVLGKTTGDSWTITEQVALIEPIYRVPLSPRFALLGGLKLGYSFEDLAFGNHFGGLPSTQYYGNGLFYQPELSLQFLMGRHVGLNLNLGYRVDEAAQVTDGRGRVLNSGGQAWRPNNSGLDAGLGLTVYFKPMF